MRSQGTVLRFLSDAFKASHYGVPAARNAQPTATAAAAKLPTSPRRLDRYGAAGDGGYTRYQADLLKFLTDFLTFNPDVRFSERETFAARTLGG